MEALLLAVFAASLLTCVAFGWSILYPLFFGFALFFAYGLYKGKTPAQMGKMAWDGVRTVKNILITFVLIGMITALWRVSGTIPFIVYHVTALCTPRLMLLLTFLFCCLVSFLTGTAFGTAATVGVICMTIANSMGLPVWDTGGAILAGSYFGDRCSPMSTSALLVSNLTETDLYRNIAAMVKTSLLPFALTCGVYLLRGLRSAAAPAGQGAGDIFLRSFSLHPIVCLPALVILVLSLLRCNVKLTMLVSILCSAAVALIFQRSAPLELLRIALLGYTPSDPALLPILSGGGVVSMARVFAIVCLSSSYAGMFHGTGFLESFQSRLERLGRLLTPFGAVLFTALLTGMVTCNQTLTVILTRQLCADAEPDAYRLASHLENTAVILPSLIPWSIACAVPLATVGAPLSCAAAACYLYLIPLWNLLVHLYRARKK